MIVLASRRVKKVGPLLTQQLPRKAPRRATITDVAALAGVSPAAVSKVINGRGRISEATADRIRKAADELRWSPSATAVALRRSRSRTVGLVLNRSQGPAEIGATSSVLLEGIESVLGPREYGLLLYVSDRSPESDANVYQLMADRKRADGVILIDSVVGDTRFELMRTLHMPAVLVGTALERDPISNVDADPPGAGIAESVQLLLSLGHKRLAYIGGPSHRVQALLRRRAFEETLRDARLTSVATIATDYSAAAAAEHTSRLLTASEKPTAILYGSDVMAIAGMRTARLHGLNVPDQLSVVGFDGLAIGEWTEPQLTTVQRDPAQRGRAAAAVLLRILGETVDEVYVLERPFLIVRGSTAAPAKLP